MLDCSDLERSRSFYQDVLQLKVLAANDRSIDFDFGNGALLALHRQTRLLAVRPGSLQLGFTVDDVDAFVADARTRLVPIFQDPYDEGTTRVAIVSDPDGYAVQVVSDSQNRH